ncbi:MAG TPA: Ppx/GppA phosphatase family protein [Ignavibacteriaceae bacterium]
MTVASIDIGTNTILLLIAEVYPVSNKITALVNLHRIPRIGKGLKKGDPFPEENIKRMFDVMDEYSETIKKYNCDKIIITGTSAFRIALNNNEISEEIKNKYGYELNVITGDEEAKYSYLGAVSGLSDKKKSLVIDIGGGSTEIIYGKGNDIIFSKSFDIGVVSGAEKFFTIDPPSDKQVDNFAVYSQKTFLELKDYVKDIDTAIAIAGTPTTLAAIKYKLKSFNEELIEGTSLTPEELNTFVSELSKLSSAEVLNKYSQIVKGREDVLLAGTILLREILKMLNIEEVKVSTKGIRYGAIFNWLNETF